jgi:hypothetical protein
MWRGFYNFDVPYTLSFLPIVPIDAPAIVASTKVGDL